MLIHQIPPKPNYFRVKIWRRLQKLGAVAIKNSVYALPSNEQAQEDLNWVLREIVEGGGDASLVEARLVEGLNDQQVREMFRSARDTDYQALADEVREVARGLPRKGEIADEKRGDVESAVARLQKRMADIAAIDFFHARSREAVDGLLKELEQKLAAREPEKEAPAAEALEKPRGATWVTRTGIHVDRMASAWLIRRFIDPEARFKFVLGHEYAPEAGELRFDMFQAEFTHDGDLCTFEVLLRHFGLKEAALRNLAEIVHDIDLKDAKFARPEAPGLDGLIAGIAMRHKEDEARLSEGAAMFDSLHAYFKRKR